MNEILNKLLHSQAVIFDMDGLITDTEPLWKQAEKEIFGQYGLCLTDDLLRQVMGFRLNEVVAYWYQYQPWSNPDFEQTEHQIIQRMLELISNSATLMPGVLALLQYLRQHDKKMAIASSSSMELIHAVVQKLQIGSYFDLLYSAQFEPYGKPHPGIFITAAKQLDATPLMSMVIEDSINGVIAAKAAKMQCIAVPESATWDDARFALADYKLASLSELLYL
jgi:HAD superfamily hydrolase (TIGR01509 family)